jgi:hypothetical protein
MHHAHQFTSARFIVERIAGDRELNDQEVFDLLMFQMRRVGMKGGTLKISVKATEAQVDKAMRELMLTHVGRYETERIQRSMPI